MHDVSRGIRPADDFFFTLFETFIPGAQNAFFVSKLLDRAKYCLEIPYESHLGLRFFLCPLMVDS